MKKILAAFVFLLIAKVNYAQYLNYTLFELLHKEDVKSSSIEFDNQYAGLLGTGFFSESWMFGRAITSNKVYSNLKLKFDVYTNKIFLNNNDTIYDLSGAGIIEFDLFQNQNDTTKFQSFVNGYSFDDVTPKKFIELIVDGKISFLKYHVKTLEEVYETSPYEKQKKFLDKNKYYIQRDGINATQTIINKKNLQKILEDKWDEITKYAKAQSVNLNNDEGWQKAIAYYNTLK